MKKSQNSLQVMRHSCSHVLAAAVKILFPKTKFAIGPAIENGFYYDFQFSKTVSEEDLSRISSVMGEIIKKKKPFIKKRIFLKNAQELFKNQPYKLELIKDLKKEGRKTVLVYYLGYPQDKDSFYDLCHGPHLNNSGVIGPFKLTSIAGAYWRGDEKKPMFTRIYGTCFVTKKQLDAYLLNQETAKESDHRKIGKELELFSFHPEAPGDVFWHPKGLTIFNELIKFWREVHQREDYVEVRTPEILTRSVWNKSGHTQYFLEKMYRVTTPDSKNWNLAIKPMNCDGGILIYKNRPRSYKEFPLRTGEIGVVHRYESSGELHGILRSREFTQDDAHIFCTPNQIKSELKRVIALCFEVYDVFGLKIDHLELSTKPKNSIGSDKVWKRAESIMEEAIKEKHVPYKINEGEGAFYGPKFDFHLQDNLGRTWQCATIQLDFAQPKNFDLQYTAQDGKRRRPVMIHRVVYGSIERFFGILIEHYAGAFPVWLSPLQVEIIPISDKFSEAARLIDEKLKAVNIRSRVDDRQETASAKIRDAEMQKIPYMLIFGEKELKKSKGNILFVSVRQRGEKELGPMPLKQFLKRILLEIENKK